MLWSALGRMIAVPFAFVAAMAIAMLVLLSLGYERIVAAMSGSAGVDSVEAIFDLIGHGALLASAATILPALTLVIIGEVARIRSALYYVIGGGVSLAAIPVLARFGPQAPAATGLWPVFATAGFAGGLVYWLLAGRRA